MVAHAFKPNTREQRQVDLYKFEARVLYRENSRTARAI